MKSGFAYLIVEEFNNLSIKIIKIKYKFSYKSSTHGYIFKF